MLDIILTVLVIALLCYLSMFGGAMLILYAVYKRIEDKLDIEAAEEFMKFLKD